MTIEIRDAEPLDTTARLVTPERVVFLYPLAGPFRRSIAYLIDMVVLVLLVILGFLLSLLLTLGSIAGLGPGLAILFALVYGYGAFCEGFFNGQTPGKRLVGIRVMTTQGVPITGSQAAIRNLVGAVDGPIPFLFLPGLASMLLTSRFQRLGDLAAGTMVVIEETKLGTKMPRVDEKALGGLLPLLPARVAAGPEMARALSDYVGHRSRFGGARREEIARHLARPLRARYALPDSAPSDAVLCAFYHRLAEREKGWRELQILLFRLEGGRSSRVAPADLLRLGELYRSACADLMLADAHDLPRDTVAFLHSLVGRAHNAVYKTRGFRLADWAGVVFDEVPRRLRSDPMLRVAALTFWGLLFLTGLLAAGRPGFAARVVGEKQIEALETMYDRPFDGAARADRNDAVATGFYIRHNAGIGLSCYAWGLAFGIGSLWTLATNAIGIGSMFGHMATAPQARNFFTFVTSHGPFELTAITFAGAAGLRLGSGLIVTAGMTRLDSLRREAARSLPIAGVSVILFVLAAFLEGFVSASPLPYAAKAAIAILSTLILAFYLFALGRKPRLSGLAGLRTED